MDEKIFNDILKQYRSGSIRWKEECRKHGYPESDHEKLRSRFKNERKKRGIPSNLNSTPVKDKDDYPETVELKTGGIIVSDKLIMICKEESKNPKRLLELHNFDPAFWEITYAKNNLWHMNQGGGDRLLCYQSKITAKPRKEPDWNKESIDKIFEDLKNIEFNFSEPRKDYYSGKNGKSLVVSIADLHLGLLATIRINNNEYNLEIAERLFLDSVYQIIDKAKHEEIEEILFCVGNDFLNTDNLLNTTSRGTPQDSAAFWFDLVDKAIELIIIATNEFLKIAPVKIYNVVSNHDEHSMYSIMKVIEATYKNNDNVFVDTSPLPRKYYKFGKNIIGLSHDLKKTMGLEIFTTEAQEYWSECNHFYFLLAHLHTAMTYEPKGKLEIYRSPTISGYSRWSNGKGFVSNEKRTQAFILDKENGIENIFNIVVK